MLPSLKQEQEATLNNFDKHFGVVMDSQTLLGKLGAGWR